MDKVAQLTREVYEDAIGVARSILHLEQVANLIQGYVMLGVLRDADREHLAPRIDARRQELKTK